MEKFLHIGVLVLGLFALGLLGAEEPRRAHGAHEHGQAVGTLAEDAGRWQLSLELPGYNLVGFEHAPNNDPQRQRLIDTRSDLDAGRWLQPDPESGCRVSSSRVETHGYGEPADRHNAAHDHAGESGHHEHDQEHDDRDHNEADHGHGAFHVSAVITCDASRRMRWLAIDLFEGYPDNHAIRLDVLSEDGAASYRLDKEDSRIRFD